MEKESKSMSYSRSLKEFCDLFKLEYPTMITANFGSTYQCKLIWYGTELYNSAPCPTEDESIIDCIMYIGKFVNSEKNFNDLMRYLKRDHCNTCMRVD